MYLVEIINPETKELQYNTEVFTTQEDAENYLYEVCEDTHGLEGIIIALSINKAVLDEKHYLYKAKLLYHT